MISVEDSVHERRRYRKHNAGILFTQKWHKAQYWKIKNASQKCVYLRNSCSIYLYMKKALVSYN